MCRTCGLDHVYLHTRYIVVLISWITLSPNVGALVRNSCYLNNGYCRYQIQVSSECDVTQNVPISLRDEAPRGGDSANHAQKMILQSTSEQSKRIRELESKLDKVLQQFEQKQLAAEKKDTVHNDVIHSTIPSHAKPKSTLSVRNSNHKRRTNDGGFAKDSHRKENQLLNKVHREFTKLRDELTRTKQKLRETEDKLANTTLRLNQSETSLSRTSRQLTDTERKLEDEQATSYRLTRELSNVRSELNTTHNQLQQAKSDIKRLQLDNWRTKSQLGDCHKQLEQCLHEKELLKRALEQALIKYHDLNLKHENVTMELNMTQARLFTCYRGKTTLFCGFEDRQICGFSQSYGDDDLNWSRGRKSTPTIGTGPSRDHTCNNGRGYYMYVEATNRTRGELARLVSPNYMGHGQQCVQFYYHMNGDQVGILNVYTVVPDQSVVPMWRAFGNQGDVWSMAKVTIGEMEARKGYQVVFEVSIGSGSAGDIAIDDVRVSDEPCFKPKSTTHTYQSVSTTPATQTVRPRRSRSGRGHLRHPESHLDN